jgi:hypothetical protein
MEITEAQYERIKDALPVRRGKLPAGVVVAVSFIRVRRVRVGGF